MLVFPMNFGLHWALFGIGSYAIRPRICSPNALFTFCIFLKKGSLKSPTWAHLGTISCKKMWFLCEKRGFEKCFKKRCPPDSNQLLFQCQEAPGEAASRAHCTDKKQLFEQQLKHCSRFLHWAQNWCRKLIGFLNSCKQLNGLFWIVVSCWENRARARGAVREPPGIGIGADLSWNVHHPAKAK